MTKENKNLIFLHIPKSAGSTLKDIIDRQYPDYRVHHISTKPDLQKSISDFQNLSQSKREKVRCVTGHGTFGLHKYLTGSTEYITMIREPVSRIISNYYYVRRSPDHRLYEEINSEEISLYEYVKNEVNSKINNQATRNIAGSNSSEYSIDTLKKAKKNIEEHFGVVGLVGRFDKSLLLMGKKLGWNNISYVKKNVTSNRPQKEDIPKRVLREIKRKNRLDVELYKHAKERLNQKLNEIDFSRELRNLRIQCWLRSLKSKTKDKAKRGLAKLGLR